MIDRAGIEPRLEQALGQRSALRQARRDHGRTNLDDLRVGLSRLLTERLGTEVGPIHLEPIAGGGTNELYRVFTRRVAEDPMILRVKTLGSGVVTDVVREFQMMTAVADRIPVPRPLVLIDDAVHLGAPALIMESMRGVQAGEDSGVRASGIGATYPAHLRAGIGAEFVAHLARLHTAPVEPTVLSAFAVPESGTTAAIDQDLAFWNRVWEEDRLTEHPSMLLAREWLEVHRPVVDQVSLLHGDYRNGNFLFDPEDGRITAILDWEMAVLGDRHRDLAYTMLGAFGDRDEHGRFLVAGLLPRDTFLRDYEAASGLRVDRDRIRYYTVHSMYWSTVSMLGTALRNARDELTHLDVMYNLMAGQAARSCAALARMVGRMT